MQVHPSQIAPSENFDIFYFLRNHTDNTTYYIRAVVYDVRTGDILQSANLTQSPNNARLFTKTVLAPADPTGYGRNIVAVATVYTDSGYSTKSTDYEEQEQYFLVRTTLPEIIGGGGGVDPRTLREIMQEELRKAVARLPKPTALPDMPFEAIFGAIGALQREINRIPKKVDTSDIMNLLRKVQSGQEGVKSDIAAIPPPEPVEPVDLSPVTDALEVISAALEDIQAGIDHAQEEQLKLALPEIKTSIEKVGKALEEKLVGVIEAQEFTFPVQRSVKKPEPAQPQPLDVSHLMS